MPNHVLNTLSVVRLAERDGDGGEVLSSIEVIKKHLTPEQAGTQREFDFNSIIPQPEGLFMGPVGAAEHQIPNWYDWNIANWGTKWNAYDTMWDGCTYPGNSDHVAGIGFNTAWSAPTPVIEALSRMYPNHNFVLEYADEDIGGGNAGRIVYNRGNIEEDEQWDEDQAREHWGWEPEEEEDEDEYVPPSICPKGNDITNDCANCIYGKTSHWDGKACVER